jgi:CBS domain-containing protein
MDSSIEHVLSEKGHDVYSITPDATVYDAVEQMCERHVGALLVVTDDVVRGIISERDVMNRVILERRDPTTTRVGQVMTHAVVCVRLNSTVREAMAVMTDRRCRHLPVVDDGRIVGLLSIGDLVRWASKEQEYEIRMLTEYVQGAYH